MDKKWSTPQLVVLAAGRPEESVLAACKLALSDLAPGPNSTMCDAPGGKKCKTGATS